MSRRYLAVVAAVRAAVLGQTYSSFFELVKRHLKIGGFADRPWAEIRFGGQLIPPRFRMRKSVVLFRIYSDSLQFCVSIPPTVRSRKESSEQNKTAAQPPVEESNFIILL
jgi:hypothetical protein